MGLNPVPATPEDAFLVWSLALPPGADPKAAAELALAALPATGGADLARLRGYLAMAARTGVGVPAGRRRRRRDN